MNFEGQIMSKEKYPNICSRQVEAIVFVILQIFLATRAVLRIGEYYSTRIFPSFISLVTCQSDALKLIARTRAKYLMNYNLSSKENSRYSSSQRNWDGSARTCLRRICVTFKTHNMYNI